MHSRVSGVRSTTSTTGAPRVGRGGPRACRGRSPEWRISLPVLPNVSGVEDGAARDELIDEYLAAREPQDRDILTPADAAGAVAALLGRGKARAPGQRIVEVGNPSRAADGWQSPHTVVDVVSDDAPFLVDSVSSALARHGYDIHLEFRPLLGGSPPSLAAAHSVASSP